MQLYAHKHDARILQPCNTGVVRRGSARAMHQTARWCGNYRQETTGRAAQTLSVDRVEVQVICTCVCRVVSVFKETVSVRCRIWIWETPLSERRKRFMAVSVSGLTTSGSVGA